MHWGNIYNGLWVFVLMILIITSFFSKKKTIKKLNKFRKLPLMVEKNSKLIFIRNLLFYIGVLFIIIALMKPQWGIKEKNVKLKGVDTIFAVDVSNSMLSQDILPSRLERVKNALSKILDDYYGGFIGLIAFAGESKVIVPLTLDYKFVKYNVKNLTPTTVLIQGTNFKELLSLVSLLFKSRETKRKLIIISDGEDTEGNLRESLKIAKNSGIKIFTIGVGTLRGSRIPILDKNGKIIGFKKDKDGNYVISKLNPEFLKKLAEESGGKFYLSSDIYKSIKQAIKYQEALSEKGISVSVVDYKEKYYYFALIGFLFLLLSFSLPIGKKELKKFSLLLIILIFNLNFTIIDKGNHYNKRGIKKYKEKKFGEALSQFQKAKEYAYYDKKLDFNIGDSLYKLKKYKEAEKYFKSGTESKDKETKKFSYYNLGNLYYNKGELGKAIKNYINSLKIDPNFKKAKNNLEIALKKLKKQKQKQSSKKQENKENKKNNNKSPKNNNKDETKKREKKEKENLKKELLNNLLENLKKKETKRRDKMMKVLNRRKNHGKKQSEKDW